MPTPTLKGLARRFGVSLSVVEGYWSEARKEYGDDYKAVMGVVMARLRNKAKHSRETAFQK